MSKCSLENIIEIKYGLKDVMEIKMVWKIPWILKRFGRCHGNQILSKGVMDIKDNLEGFMELKYGFEDVMEIKQTYVGLFHRSCI